MIVETIHTTRADIDRAIELFGLESDPPSALKAMIELPDGDERSTVTLVWESEDGWRQFFDERIASRMETVQEQLGGPPERVEPVRLFIR